MSKPMSNVEAIYWLQQIKEKYIHGVDEDFDEKRKQAIDIAVECLQKSN